MGFGLSQPPALLSSHFAEESRRENEARINGLCNPYTVCEMQLSHAYFQPFHKVYSFSNYFIIQPHAYLGKGAENTDAAPARGVMGKFLHYTPRRHSSTFDPILSGTIEDPIHLDVNLDMNATLQTNQSIITAYYRSTICASVCR